MSELACAEGRAVVVVVNKWDRVDQDKWTVETYTEEVRAQLRHVSWATVVCTMAHKGARGVVLGGLWASVLALLMPGQSCNSLTTATEVLCCLSRSNHPLTPHKYEDLLQHLIVPPAQEPLKVYVAVHTQTTLLPLTSP